MLDPVTQALDVAAVTLAELGRRCCDDGRSPRLAALDSQLQRIRAELGRLDGCDQDDVVALLEQAGATVGELQVGCCAPDRLPLYATLLEQLNIVQRHLAPMH